ncbi:MAG: DUF4339 domain-containing protein [Alicyclobacillus macrosporangiidus]|uniref:DUF4339 domain-containing protein n=1 Tax=Alicyclobacillus macrosporangiidus TaxID=392015 RepID=UPI0026F32128|nr:DUF4339 domain-containing protein [Alicyclobacillus macrosporangiidus]MCL6597938.1 DUF4339 domain-containing protein [Alicyclobacillus macrosporangiidus]
MLIALLLGCLLIVVVFHKEIKALITLLFLAFVMYGMWYAGTWGRMIDIGFGVVFIAVAVISAVKGFRSAGQQPSRMSEPNGHQPVAPPVQKPDGWYYSVGAIEKGPVSEEQLLTLLRERKLPPNTLIRWSGVDRATPANQIWANRF